MPNDTKAKKKALTTFDQEAIPLLHATGSRLDPAGIKQYATTVHSALDDEKEGVRSTCQISWTLVAEGAILTTTTTDLVLHFKNPRSSTHNLPCIDRSCKAALHIHRYLPTARERRRSQRTEQHLDFPHATRGDICLRLFKSSSKIPFPYRLATLLFSFRQA